MNSARKLDFQMEKKTKKKPQPKLTNNSEHKIDHKPKCES